MKPAYALESHNLLIGDVTMTSEKIQLAVRKISPQTYVIDITGEINAFAENALMEAYTQATSQGAKQVVLNFSNLAYMNSSGIGLLVTLLIRANRQKQRLVACGLSEHYQQIFELTRLNEAIVIYPSEAEALAALN
jgi:anti-sigma B factor antagonist